MIRATRRLCLATLLLLPLGCATASGPAPVAFATPEAAPLPNATLATSIPLVPAVDAVVLGALAPERAARTPSAAEFAARLTAADQQAA